MKRGALVTGGTKRIGKAIALSLAKKGYDIAVTYNQSKDESIQLGNELAQYNVAYYPVQCALDNEEQTALLVASVREKMPGLSVLINNASIFVRSTLQETDTELLKKMYATNFFAPYILTREFARLTGTGDIINIIDSKAVKNGFNYSAYVLSKKSLLDLTLQSAVELGPNIRVNGVAPGLILPPDGETFDYLDRLAEKVPLKKRGDPEVICSAVSFLLDNSYLTGQIIFADGGQHAVKGE